MIAPALNSPPSRLEVESRDPVDSDRRPGGSGRCVFCRRPKPVCLCDALPRIDNQTPILILQHRRERFHPFNTARIVNGSLSRCQLWADHTPSLGKRFEAASLPPGTGLLYPGRDAAVLTELSADQMPSSMVILDGTWHQAKTLLREIPRLQSLPKFQLSPESPSRFRIRREPTDQALSTLEAVVQTLQAIEPETAEIEQLLRVFDQMVDTQLANPKSGWRKNARRTPGASNVPKLLIDHADRVVVAYGEREIGGRGNDDVEAAPVHWVARRRSTGDIFDRVVDGSSLENESFVGRLALSPQDLRSATPLNDVAQAWRRFLDHDDIVVTPDAGTARMHAAMCGGRHPAITMKSIHIPGSPFRIDPSGADSQLQAEKPHRPRAWRRLDEAAVWLEGVIG